LSSPDITEKEIIAVNEVLQTRFLALGPKLVEFEEKMAGYVGRRYGVAVNSGTSGLHLLVRALGIGEGDEVITTPFSFIASANCILFERARPVFVDIDPDTLNINPALIDNRMMAAGTGSFMGNVIITIEYVLGGEPCESSETDAYSNGGGCRPGKRGAFAGLVASL
jgi:dTDP-4-amino-4,6-dideoxygalactose transaminase